MKNIKYYLTLAIVSSTLLLQACGSAEKRGEVSNAFDAAPVEDSGTFSDSGIVDTGRVQHSIGNAAVVAIWQRAEEARLTGDYEAAIAQLERAIRIDPTDPVVWSRMAEMRFKQGNYIAAENIATKSNQLNNGQKEVLQYRNWLLIAQARQANGDEQGADEANQRAQIYR